MSRDTWDCFPKEVPAETPMMDEDLCTSSNDRPKPGFLGLFHDLIRESTLECRLLVPMVDLGDSAPATRFHLFGNRKEDPT